MLSCLLFGLVVLVVIFLVPLIAQLFSSIRARVIYAYTLLSVYIGEVLWLTLVNRWGGEVSRVRFEPFSVLRQIMDCWFGFHPISVARCKAIFKNSAHLFDSVHATPIEDFLLNIILFMPLGFLLPYVWPKLNFWKTTLLGFAWSAFVEGTQYVAQLGCCDIDDMINNTLGTCVGYGCFLVYKKITQR